MSHTVLLSNTDGILPSYLRKLCHLRFFSAEDNASVAAVSFTGTGVVHDERRAVSECRSQSFTPIQTGEDQRIVSWTPEISSGPGGLSQQKRM